MEEKTNYQLSSSINEGILEIVGKGVVTENTIDRLHDEIIKIVMTKNAKAVLCDVRALKGSDDIAAAYFRVRRIPPSVKGRPYAAVVDSLENADYQSFYETTSGNVGHLAKFFTDIEAARAWLKSRL